MPPQQLSQEMRRCVQATLGPELGAPMVLGCSARDRYSHTFAGTSDDRAFGPLPLAVGRSARTSANEQPFNRTESG